MKKIILSLLTVIISFALFAQSPQTFRYQTIVRNSEGEILANQEVSFQISIMRDSLNYAPSYYETHDLETNEFGLVTLNIGLGTPSYGQFDTINWGSKDYYLEIELDDDGGTNFVLLSTSQILSVSYAQFAEDSSITDDNDWIRNGNYIFAINHSIRIGSNDGTNRQIFMFTDGSASDSIFTVATSQNNGIWEADFTILQNGNIGINTSTPALKLHINHVMRLKPRTSAPSSPSVGDLYVNSSDHHIYYYLNG